MTMNPFVLARRSWEHAVATQTSAKRIVHELWSI